MKRKTANYDIVGSNYHALVWREEKWSVARCVEMELASQGKTKQEALDNLKEALELLLEDEKKGLIKHPTFYDLELQPLAYSG